MKDWINMICYKDKTFCISSKSGKCSNEACWRFFTEADRIGSEKWWSSVDNDERGPPIAWSDFWDNCDIKIERENYENTNS